MKLKYIIIIILAAVALYGVYRFVAPSMAAAKQGRTLTAPLSKATVVKPKKAGQDLAYRWARKRKKDKRNVNVVLDQNGNTVAIKEAPSDFIKRNLV